MVDSNVQITTQVDRNGRDSVDLAEQRRLLALWDTFRQSRPPSNNLLRQFYLEVVKETDLYAYGCVFEVFDVLTNGEFDGSALSSWNGRGARESAAA